jgi:hypothetical protein
MAIHVRRNPEGRALAQGAWRRRASGDRRVAILALALERRPGFMADSTGRTAAVARAGVATVAAGDWRSFGFSIRVKRPIGFLAWRLFLDVPSCFSNVPSRLDYCKSFPCCHLRKMFLLFLVERRLPISRIASRLRMRVPTASYGLFLDVCLFVSK